MEGGEAVIYSDRIRKKQTPKTLDMHFKKKKKEEEERNQTNVSSTVIPYQSFGLLYSFIRLRIISHPSKQVVYFICHLFPFSFFQKRGKKKKFRKPSYTNFTGAMSWKLIGLLAKMLKTTEG